MSLDKELTIQIVDGELRISIDLDLLAFAVTHDPFWPEEWIVSDLDKFGKSMKQALSEEDEDGTTPVHKLFDGVAEYALNQGYEGFAEIVEHDD